MGIVNFGAPIKETLFFKEIMNLDTFIETGTYTGNTSKNMSKYFKKVYTIEASKKMYDVAQSNLKNFENVELIFGKSQEVIEQLFPKENNILFWLDAHWSGGDTYGEEDECPLIAELRSIFKLSDNKNFCVLIDDARLFTSPPPKPHSYKRWPSITEIINEIPRSWHVIIYDDVIYLFPENVTYKVKDFFQEEVTKRWLELSKFEDSFLGKLFKRFGLRKC